MTETILLTETDPIRAQTTPKIGQTQSPIVISNSSFIDDQDFVIDARNFNQLQIQLKNAGLKDLDYEVYATLNPIEIAPIYSILEYFPIFTFDKIKKGENLNIPLLNLDASWVMIRLAADGTDLDYTILGEFRN